MADDTCTTPRAARCYLSELPRELRDMLYCHVESKHEVHTGTNAEPLVTILYGPSRSVLLANRQIHDEYLDVVASRATVTFHLGEPNGRPQPPLLPSYFPFRLLQKITHVSIAVHWTHAPALDTTRSALWMEGLTHPNELFAIEERYESWTPWKGN